MAKFVIPTVAHILWAFDSLKDYEGMRNEDIYQHLLSALVHIWGHLGLQHMLTASIYKKLKSHLEGQKNS